MCTWCSFGLASKQEIVVADTKQAGQGLHPQQVTLEVGITVAMDPCSLQLIHLGWYRQQQNINTLNRNNMRNFKNQTKYLIVDD